MKVAILQPNYIPWKGVFDLIYQSDVFVFLEDVQYTKADWRNRNKIMTENGSAWLTVPVITKGKYYQKIYEAEIYSQEDWQTQHLRQITYYYRNAKHFDKFKWLLDDIYVKNTWQHISKLNKHTTMLLSDVLGIKSNFVSSLDIPSEGDKDDKLLAICRSLGATSYLSGPSAKNYIVPEKFEKENIALEYIEYIYPEYAQQFQPFDHNVSVLDLIINCGNDASYNIWGWREKI